MNRRAFISGLSLAILAAPLAVGAQQPTKIYRLGLISGGWPTTSGPLLSAFRQGLRDLGWLEGQNIAIETRWGEGRTEELPRLASELIAVPVDAIVAWGPPVIHALRQATTTIPIVMAVVHEPVAFGFIKSFAQPGGNITGLAFQDSELSTKRLELLKAIVPRMRRVAVVWDPIGGGSGALRAAETAAKALGLKTQAFEIMRPEQLPAALASARKGGAQAVIQLASPFFSAHRARLIELAASHSLPMTCERDDFVAEGCLMAYGPSFADMSRRAASFVDRILKGAKPADLPVEQPTKFELVINMRTAQELGLTIPQSVLLRADKVIE